MPEPLEQSDTYAALLDMIEEGGGEAFYVLVEVLAAVTVISAQHHLDPEAIVAAARKYLDVRITETLESQYKEG